MNRSRSCSVQLNSFFSWFLIICRHNICHTWIISMRPVVTLERQDIWRCYVSKIQDFKLILAHWKSKFENHSLFPRASHYVDNFSTLVFVGYLNSIERDYHGNKFRTEYYYFLNLFGYNERCKDLWIRENGRATFP